MEVSLLEISIAYLKSHPLVAVGLGILLGFFLSNLLRRMIRIALILGLILLAGLYWLHRQAEADWQVRVERLKHKAAELGRETLEKGEVLLEEGKQEIQKQLEKGKAKKDE